MICVGQSLAFIQCNDFISIVGQQRDHWSVLLSSMLCGLQNTLFCLINGADKLYYYT